MAKKGTSPIDAAFGYLSGRARTVREMELYLDSKEYGEYEVYQVIERLKELNYLNDEKYAADFVASRLATKPVSRRKLSQQLYGHKLPPDVIDGALAAVTDAMEADNAVQVAKRFCRQFAALPEDERARRTAQRLVGRGYDYDVIRSALLKVMDTEVEVDMSDAGDEAEE